MAGLFQPSGDLVGTWRMVTDARRTDDEHFVLLAALLTRGGFKPAEVDSMIVSSTVPRLRSVLRSVGLRHLGLDPVVVGPTTRTGLTVAYEDPGQVGPDRLANAVGAVDLFGGGPVVVVDFGTATTLDATSAEGVYLGGAILPGIEVSMESLFSRAAALSWVELFPPVRAIATSTAESVRSGVLFGFAGAVDALCRRFAQELGPAPVVSTGGLGELIAPLSECIGQHEPWLTLRGLRLIHRLNRL
ncbi:MAG: type III pantothenate kinase [Acidimicrobiales bacterium]